MTEHKFEPFQQVLVRSGDKWVAAHFSHVEPLSTYKFCCTSGLLWAQCIPYTPETAHLLGTSQPYEPPKPPVDESERFKTGEIVEVCSQFFAWNEAVYLKFISPDQHKVYNFKGDFLTIKTSDEIRPLPDTAAH